MVSRLLANLRESAEFPTEVKEVLAMFATPVVMQEYPSGQ
jgi:hypothetical protein